MRSLKDSSRRVSILGLRVRLKLLVANIGRKRFTSHYPVSSFEESADAGAYRQPYQAHPQRFLKR